MQTQANHKSTLSQVKERAQVRGVVSTWSMLASILAVRSRAPNNGTNNPQGTRRGEAASAAYIFFGRADAPVVS